MRTGWPRLWIVAGAGIAGVLAISSIAARDGAKPVGSLPLSVAVEPATRLVISMSGGTVKEIEVHAGDSVQPGQLMVRLTAPQWTTQGRELQATVRALEGALAQRKALAGLPLQARALIHESQPDVVRAEDDYVRALADFDHASGQTLQAAKTRLEAAAETRLRVHQQSNGRVPSNTENLRRLLTSAQARLAELTKLQQQTEVLATVAGRVDILDLRVGDSILPGHPVALLVLDGEYVTEMIVPDSVAARVVPGMPLKCTLLTSGDTVDARLESVSHRPIPVVLRESRQIAEENILRIRIISATPIKPGALVHFELP